MYQVDELVFYGSTGVCRIEGIAMQTMPGLPEQLCYTMNPVHQQCIIHTPVNSDKVFMHSVISREEVEELIKLIPTIQAEPYHSKATGELAEHYAASIQTHNCESLIELTMWTYAKKQELEGRKRKFGVVDVRFMKQAEELLFGELPVALDLPKEEVPAYIASRVEAM